MHTAHSEATLAETLITPELARRKSRRSDYAGENRALVALAREMAASPETILQKLVDTALELCRADSAGISILEPGEGAGVFRWHAIAGAFASNLGATMARDLSPCGIVLDRDTALLFDRPARYFTELAAAEPPIFENLLVPFHAAGRPVGTVSAIAHSPDRRFDAEDARLLQNLSQFAAAAYQLTTALRAETEARGGLERWVRKRTGALAEANEALRTSEERYRTLFESIDEGFCIIEMLFDDNGAPVDYRFLEINPTFEKQTGLKQAVNKTMRELAPKHEAHWFKIYGNVALTGKPVRFENVADALNRWFDVYAFRVGLPEDRKVAVLFKDITERKRAEEALHKADQRKDEFLATLAHELRNPLAPLKNALEILRVNDSDRKNVTRMREKMERQVDHLTRLVDDLLEVSRITRGKIELRKAKVELKAVIEHAIEISQPLIETAGHDLNITLPQQPLYVYADPVRLAQVIANLLNNAVKYTDGKGCIELDAARAGADAVVRVRDTGIGMSPASLPGIFDLFVQTEESLRRAQGGLGVGLTLVKRIVELHGGSVRARSDGLGRGSEFIVRLPVNMDEQPLAENPRSVTRDAVATPRKVLVVDDNAAAADTLGELLDLYGNDVRARSDGLGRGSEFIVRLPVNMDEQPLAENPRSVTRDAVATPRKVLVVDDNAAAADTLGELLDLYGNDVRVVHDGKAALDVFDAWRPDVMLLDIGMPGMDGYEVARRVRRLPESDRVMLIALTGLGQDKDRRLAHEAGFDHHLLKPLDLQALRALLDAPPRP